MCAVSCSFQLWSWLDLRIQEAQEGPLQVQVTCPRTPRSLTLSLEKSAFRISNQKAWLPTKIQITESSTQPISLKANALISSNQNLTVCLRSVAFSLFSFSKVDDERLKRSRGQKGETEKRVKRPKLRLFGFVILVLQVLQSTYQPFVPF